MPLFCFPLQIIKQTMIMIPKFKIGLCECGNMGNGRKVGKVFMCMRCYNVKKGEEAVMKAVERQKRGTALIYARNKLRQTERISPDQEKQLQLLDNFFKDMRKKMTGTCACGCNKPSSKLDNKYYKYSISHIFPKRTFKSISTHKLNWVERAFWGGCHSRMDDTSLDNWTSFADWENIKEKFHELAPLLTDEERATKFYIHLEKLVYQ